MSHQLVGSDLTLAMLKRGDEQVWCAVSNESEQDAISTIKNVDGRFIMHIVSFEDGCFLCKEESTWKYAVPIKIIAMTASDARIQAPMNIS